VNFSEEVTYELRRQPVRGLSFPVNEIKTRSITSFTNLQVLLSPRHVLNFHVNTFPLELDFANINALIPQTASTSYGRSGVSAGFSDSYQFGSGALLNTLVRYTRFDSNAHGQGPLDMEISPEGWAEITSIAGTAGQTSWKYCQRISSLRSPGMAAMK